MIVNIMLFIKIITKNNYFADVLYMFASISDNNNNYY